MPYASNPLGLLRPLYTCVMFTAVKPPLPATVPAASAVVPSWPPGAAAVGGGRVMTAATGPLRGMAAGGAAHAHGHRHAAHEHGGVPCGGHGVPHAVERARHALAPAAPPVPASAADDDDDGDGEVSAVAGGGGGGGSGKRGKGRGGKKR
jgi:hypothetical protein